ncbi:MAG: hypothetical protein AAB214_01515, partial [Fibrobacterota bacterium]
MNRTAFLFATCALWLLSCDRNDIAGTNNETQSKGTFYQSNGKPAVNARVRVYATNQTVTDSASPLVTQSYVDANGNVELKLAAGHYSLVADSGSRACFVDSIYSDGDKIWIPIDTLRPTGTIIGRVRVQPMHSPAIAWIHLLRTNISANVDSTGMFRIAGVPSGSYEFVAVTRHEGYAPTRKPARSVSDSTVDIGEIVLNYTGLPLVTGLEASYDSLSGIVNLNWNDTASVYTVYREIGAPSGNAPPALVEVQDASYSDTIFHPLGLTFSVYDSIETDVTYWIATKNSAQTGPLWNKVQLHLKSPALSKRWNDHWRSIPFPSNGHVWMIDTTTSGMAMIMWHPTTGLDPSIDLTILRPNGTWAQPAPLDPDVFQDECASWTFWKGRLWTVKGLSMSGRFDDSTQWIDTSGAQLIKHTRVFDTILLRSSADGRDWDSLRIPVGRDSVTHFTFRPTANELNIVFKYDRSLNMGAPIAFKGRISSTNGKNWQPAAADFWATRNCSVSSGYSELAYTNIAAPDGHNLTLAKFRPLGVSPPAWLLPGLETDTAMALLHTDFQFEATVAGQNLLAFYRSDNLNWGTAWIASIDRPGTWQRLQSPECIRQVIYWQGQLVALGETAIHFATLTPN